MKHLITPILVACAVLCMAAPMRNSKYSKQKRVTAAPAVPPVGGKGGQHVQSGSDRKVRDIQHGQKDWRSNYLPINNNGGGQTWYH